MQNTALKIINSKIKELKEHKFNCSPIEKKQYNFETTVSKNGNKNKLQVYFGKKGVKSVIQGNSDTKEYKEIQSIITGNFSLQFSEKEDQNYDEYIGTDETGKGDYFGPLVIAGCYVDSNIQKFLSNLGVRDSKELVDSRIDKMADEIKSKYPNNFSIISIEPEKYNKIYLEFNNVNKLLNWGHSKVIENIYKKYQPNDIIVDQFSKTPLNISLKKEFAKVNFVQIPKAEKYIGVAAASILARNEMNQWFNKMKREGFNVLKGASFEVESAAKGIYRIQGRQTMSNLVKLHFKTTKKIFED
jgi:ribonuclease HIII